MGGECRKKARLARNVCRRYEGADGRGQSAFTPGLQLIGMRGFVGLRTSYAVQMPLRIQMC